MRALFEDRAAADAWLADWREVAGDGVLAEDRVARMRKCNPIFIPRNHRVEQAIQAAMRGDYAPFERMTSVWAKPFLEQPDHAELEDAALPEEHVHQTFCGT